MDNQPGGGPQTLWQLIRLLARGAVRVWLKNLPVMIILGALVWVVHTYLLVFLNEGSNPGTSWLLNSILTLQGRLVSGMLFWTLLAGLTTAILVRIKQDGWAKFSHNVRMAPEWVREAYRDVGLSATMYVLGGIGTALLVSSWINNPIVSFQLSLLVAGALMAHYASLPSLALRLGWSDAQRKFRRGQPVNPLDPSTAEVILFGAGIGFLAWFFMLLLLPIGPIIGTFAAAIIFIILWTKLRGQAQGGVSAPGATAHVIVWAALFTGALLTVLAKLALADDGGWMEAGGTLAGWLKSGGAIPATMLGLPAAFGTLVGLGIGMTATGPALVGVFQPPEPTGEGGAPGAPPDLVSVPLLGGGVGDNPFTNFSGGNGPGMCGGGLPNYWVNTATLNLVVQDTVFAMHGLGPGIRLTQTYNSFPGPSGMFGRNWRFSYESEIEKRGNIVYVRKGSGQWLQYQLAHEGPPYPVECTPSGGRSDRLIDHGDHWLLISKLDRMTYRYDKTPGAAIARLTSITDRNGNNVRIAYNSDGTINSVTDAAGRSTTFGYDGNKRCTSISVPGGNRATYNYDGSDNLIRATDLAGIVTGYTYDGEHYLTAMTVGGDRTTKFSYQKHPEGRLIASVTDATGAVRRYEMVSSTPRQVRETDPEGGVTSYFSTNGLTERVVDPLGNASETTFVEGRPVALRNKNGRIRRVGYDDRGSIIRYTDERSNSLTLAYDDDDSVISETDLTGGRTTYDYDDRHNLVRITYPTGRSVNMDYNDKGQMRAMANNAGTRITFDYDNYGNLAALTEPGGKTSRMSYDPDGLHLRSLTDPKGNVTKYEHDANGRLTKVVHPDGSVVTRTYDCCAGTALINENGDRKTFVRNLREDIEALSNPSGSAIRFGRDRNGRLTKVMDPLGRNVTLEYDPAGRIVGMTNQAGRTATAGYDPEGNMTEVRDERGGRMAFAYDAKNLPVEMIDPLGHMVKFEREAMGRLTAVTNARGEKVSYAYDGDGQPVSVSYDGTRTVTYEYNSVGNLTKMMDASGETLYEYNESNRVTVIRYPDGLEVKFSYDELGNYSSVIYPDGLVVRYSYDPRGRVTRVDWGEGYIDYSFDPAANLVGEKRSNGTESSYNYDIDRHIVGVKHWKDDTIFTDRIYTRDPAGNITDESGALPLDPVIGDVSVKTTYNVANQIVSRNGDRFDYDPDGNLTEISSGWKAVYDPENRLVELIRDGESTRYVYNGKNQRSKVVRGSRVRNVYHDSMGRPLFETDETGRIIAKYIHAIGYLAARIDTDGESQFYHFDKTGNTLAMTNGKGDIIATYAYDAYGAVVNKSGDTDNNPFTYVGAFWVMDGGGGLFFMTNRHYDAATGRFIQKDPIALRGGLNLYAYAAGNPITGIDPEGTQLMAPAAGLAALVLLTCTTFVLATYNAMKCGEDVGKGQLNTTLDAIARRAEDPSKVTADDINKALGPDPKKNAKDFANVGVTILDKGFGVHPVLSQGYSTGKGILQTANGDVKEGGVTLLGGLPDQLGTLGTAIGELRATIPTESTTCTAPTTGTARINK